MTVYGVVITVLLAFPWTLVAVTVAGAAWSAVARRLERWGNEPNRRCAPAAATRPARSSERSVSRLQRDHSRIGQYEDSRRRAA